MERESFENDEIAAILNEYFVPIKVDREERPDVDRVYMNFVQVFTLNMFVTFSIHSKIAILSSLGDHRAWWLANECLVDARSSTISWWDVLSS